MDLRKIGEFNFIYWFKFYRDKIFMNILKNISHAYIDLHLSLFRYLVISNYFFISLYYLYLSNSLLIFFSISIHWSIGYIYLSLYIYLSVLFYLYHSFLRRKISSSHNILIFQLDNLFRDD